MYSFYCRQINVSKLVLQIFFAQNFYPKSEKIYCAETIHAKFTVSLQRRTQYPACTKDI
jgi:hypothetical protein